VSIKVKKERKQKLALCDRNKNEKWRFSRI